MAMKLHVLSLELSDIDQVLLSHLHVDHAGNAAMFADTGAA